MWNESFKSAPVLNQSAERMRAGHLSGGFGWAGPPASLSFRFSRL